jgi:hypothetical protein
MASQENRRVGKLEDESFLPPIPEEYEEATYRELGETLLELRLQYPEIPLEDLSKATKLSVELLKQVEQGVKDSKVQEYMWGLLRMGRGSELTMQTINHTIVRLYERFY